MPVLPCQALSIVDLRINGTRQTGAVRKTKLPFSGLVAAVSNCAYAVLLETLVTIYRTAPAGERKCLFIFSIYYSYGQVWKFTIRRERV